MNTITMNFKDGAEMNAVYSQLKKRYPKIEITRNENPAIRAMEKMQEAMAGEADRLGFQGEEDALKWFDEAREEIWAENRR